MLAKYRINSDEAKLIDRNFSYHQPFGDQPERYVELRSMARSFAEMITNLVPVSRERSLALTKLEEAVMWANAGIARNESQTAKAEDLDLLSLETDPNAKYQLPPQQTDRAAAPSS